MVSNRKIQFYFPEIRKIFDRKKQQSYSKLCRMISKTKHLIDEIIFYCSLNSLHVYSHSVRITQEKDNPNSQLCDDDHFVSLVAPGIEKRTNQIIIAIRWKFERIKMIATCTKGIPTEKWRIIINVSIEWKMGNVISKFVSKFSFDMSNGALFNCAQPKRLKITNKTKRYAQRSQQPASKYLVIWIKNHKSKNPKIGPTYLYVVCS